MNDWALPLLEARKALADAEAAACIRRYDIAVAEAREAWKKVSEVLLAMREHEIDSTVMR